MHKFLLSTPPPQSHSLLAPFFCSVIRVPRGGGGRFQKGFPAASLFASLWRRHLHLVPLSFRRSLFFSPAYFLFQFLPFGLCLLSFLCYFLPLLAWLSIPSKECATKKLFHLLYIPSLKYSKDPQAPRRDPPLLLMPFNEIILCLFTAPPSMEANRSATQSC